MADNNPELHSTPTEEKTETTHKRNSFVFYDRGRKCVRDWRYEYRSTFLRDFIWNQYLEQLDAIHGE